VAGLALSVGKFARQAARLLPGGIGVDHMLIAAKIARPNRDFLRRTHGAGSAGLQVTRQTALGADHLAGRRAIKGLAEAATRRR
jgi:hypothetical protein